MRDGEPSEPDRPVLPWRLVAGALLHVAVPAYLLVLGAWFVAAWPVAAPLALVGRASAAFCLGFAALLLAASVLAALLDPPLRRRRHARERTDPAARRRGAESACARALRAVEAIGGIPVAAAAARLRDARWNFADDQCQAIVADLARAVHALAAAHASAAPDRRAALGETIVAVLDRVTAAVEERAADRARLDEGDALTHARYLAARYPGAALDLAGPDRD